VDTWVFIGTIAAAICAVASVIAAGVVIWERWHWATTRPSIDVRAELSQQPDIDPLGEVSGDRYQGRVRNWGTENAFGIQVLGFNCTVNMSSLMPDPLPPDGRLGGFRIEVDPDNIEHAWFILSWRTQFARRHRHAAWYPVLATGDLAAVRGRQIDRGRLRRITARMALSGQPGPLSVAEGRLPAAPPQSPRQVAAFLPTRRPWWRRALMRIFRFKPDPIAMAATDV
jgi:hypothetical protein